MSFYTVNFPFRGARMRQLPFSLVIPSITFLFGSRGIWARSAPHTKHYLSLKSAGHTPLDVSTALRSAQHDEREKSVIPSLAFLLGFRGIYARSAPHMRFLIKTANNRPIAALFASRITKKKDCTSHVSVFFLSNFHPTVVGVRFIARR